MHKYHWQMNSSIIQNHAISMQRSWRSGPQQVIRLVSGNEDSEKNIHIKQIYNLLYMLLLMDLRSLLKLEEIVTRLEGMIGQTETLETLMDEFVKIVNSNLGQTVEKLFSAVQPTFNKMLKYDDGNVQKLFPRLKHRFPEDKRFLLFKLFEALVDESKEI